MAEPTIRSPPITTVHTRGSSAPHAHHARRRCVPTADQAHQSTQSTNLEQWTHTHLEQWTHTHTHNTPGAVDTNTHTTHTHTHTPGAVDTHTWSSGHTPGAVDTHTPETVDTHTYTPGEVDTPGAVTYTTHTPGAVDTHTHTLEQWTHPHTPGAVDTHTPGAVDTHTHTHTTRGRPIIGLADYRRRY